MTFIRKNDDIKSVNFDGEIALIDIHNGAYYYMDSIGSIIWEKIQSPSSVIQIASQLISQYDVDIETCKNHVYDFIVELIDRDLVSILI